MTSRESLRISKFVITGGWLMNPGRHVSVSNEGESVWLSYGWKMLKQSPMQAENSHFMIDSPFLLNSSCYNSIQYFRRDCNITLGDRAAPITGATRPTVCMRF
jgi:hypothetical protein